jgi:hypothetical protein
MLYRKRLYFLLAALVLLTMLLPGCKLSPASKLSWQAPAAGQTVYGIVRLAVHVDGNNTTAVLFYLDTVDTEHVLSPVISIGGRDFSCDWYAQEATNGEHKLWAVTGTGESLALTVSVENPPRTGSILAGTLKMTPQNDPAPPRLLDAYKEVWQEPVPVEGPVNTAGAEDSPFILPDGNTMYFWYNGDQTKTVQEQVYDPMTGVHVAKKVNGLWQEPQRLYLQYFDKLSFDGAAMQRGNTLWFAAIREGNYRSVDMWTAELVNGRWTNWQNAGQLLNQIYEVGELHVTADGNEIYFNSTRAGGKGQSDIWVTRRVNGKWQEPENITVVNTAENEGQPFVSEDGTELWFTRSIGGASVFRSVKVNGEWQIPEMIVTSLAGEPTLDTTGNLYFVHHRWDSNLNRATEADIYVCYRR